MQVSPGLIEALIGGVMVFKNSGLDKVMEEIGLENIVLEPDAPYLAPVPFTGEKK
jgi:TatD DNase family protein